MLHLLIPTSRQDAGGSSSITTFVAAAHAQTTTSRHIGRCVFHLIRMLQWIRIPCCKRCAQRASVWHRSGDAIHASSSPPQEQWARSNGPCLRKAHLHLHGHRNCHVHASHAHISHLSDLPNLPNLPKAPIGEHSAPPRDATAQEATSCGPVKASQPRPEDGPRCSKRNMSVSTGSIACTCAHHPKVFLPSRQLSTRGQPNVGIGK